MFLQILITLISFDIACIVFNVLLFSLPHLSEHYFNFVFPYIVPTVLPFAQIALTGKYWAVSNMPESERVCYCHAFDSQQVASCN